MRINIGVAHVLLTHVLRLEFCTPTFERVSQLTVCNHIGREGDVRFAVIDFGGWEFVPVLIVTIDGFLEILNAILRKGKIARPFQSKG